MFSDLKCYIELHGLVGLLHLLRTRIVKFQANCYGPVADVLTDAKGLEIGGPSKIFSTKGFFPVYPIVGHLDNCTYGDHTIWEGKISEGNTFVYRKENSPGRQYILEASDLHEIADDTYDFLLSSHVLEHLSNPLKGLQEWKRVVKPNGILIIVVPHKDGTFDHLRSVSSFEHIQKDYLEDTPENDLTHLDEALKKHDLRLDKGMASFTDFREQLERNYETRCMHQHVFNTPLIAEMLNHAGLEILELEPVRPCHVLAIARKVDAGTKVANDRFLDRELDVYRQSPFRSDRERNPLQD